MAGEADPCRTGTLLSSAEDQTRRRWCICVVVGRAADSGCWDSEAVVGVVVGVGVEGVEGVEAAGWGGSQTVRAYLEEDWGGREAVRV